MARLRLSVFDSYLRALPRQIDPSFPVRIIAIDEAALAREGQWPWPRTKLADLVSRLSAAGARTISFDILFAEPDRLSPSELLRALGDQEGIRQIISELAKLPSNDERLARSVAAAPVILGVAGDANGPHNINASRTSLSFAGDDPHVAVPEFAGGIGNLPVLTAAASGIGAVNWLPSQDQVVRRVPLLVSIAGNIYPSLALETLRVGAGQSTIFVKSSGGSGVAAFGQRNGIESLRVGKTILPSDARGELWLKFSPADTRRTISASKILDNTFSAADINARHVFIGATAAGLLDLRATPLDRSVSGVEIHAQALEQMLSGDHLIRPAYATGAEIAFLIAAGALVAWLISRSGALLAAVFGGLGIAGVLMLSWMAYSQAGLLLDPVFPALSVSLVYLALSLPTYVKSELERARIRTAFGHYVSPSLVEELANTHENLKLGGEMREVTLMFADVRGFSKISEGLGAEQLIRFVNRLFTPLTDTILNHRGTIDKFMGDAVMAFWNAPVPDADHAKNACRAALAMLDDLRRLNETLADEAYQGGERILPVRIGIGLNTGTCVVGNVGSPQRFDYSVLGDVVNAAARFEDETKAFGASIIIGGQTAAVVGDFATLELGLVQPRGKDRPERIFALLGDEVVARSNKFTTLRSVHFELMASHTAGNRNTTLAALAACRSAATPETLAIYERFATRNGYDTGA